MYTISVVIPTYNRANVVMRSIESIVSQTVKPQEIIVVDDGSDDSTNELLKEDSRIRYFRLPSNMGAAYARNFGVRQAKGDFIAFQDSDDAWDVKKLHRQLKLLADDPSLDIIVTGVTLIKENGDTEAHILRSNYKNSWQLNNFKNYAFGTSTWLVRRSLMVLSGGFDVVLPNAEDYEFLVRVKRSAKIGIVSEALVKKYISDDGIDGSLEKSKIAADMLLEKFEKYWRESIPQLEIMFYRLAIMAFREGKMKEGRVALIRGGLIANSHLKYMVWYFISFLGRGWFLKIYVWRERWLRRNRVSKQC